jgi:hypothetical protein
MDNLTICDRCGSDACYTQEVSPEITNYMCYGCGFISNSLMTEGSEFLTQQAEILPELYKDLMITDEHGKVWMPNMVNHPDKGMVFAQGSNRDEWRWTGVKAVKVTEEEKKKYPKPGKKNEYYEFRMDMTTSKHFGERDFMEALEYIGILGA